MYSYRADTHKYRWRKYAAAALYAIFLLAEGGEFFVSHNEKFVWIVMTPKPITVSKLQSISQKIPLVGV